MNRLLVSILSLLISLSALAQPATPTPPKKPPAPAPQDPNRTIPPTGKPLAPADLEELKLGIGKLGKEIGSARIELFDKPALIALLPDIQIYYNAIRYPILYNEPIDPKIARAALADAFDRLAQLRAGDPKWIHVSGPRGYISKIDDSVQPYVLTVPPIYKPEDKKTKYRFDFWCHGRGEDLMELKFIRGKGEAGPDHFTVNLYGRYCCANKFAGEIDLLEALEDVKKRYNVDENRLVDIGFSMGGAASWQFVVHYSDLFAAASPGAGFAESREFLHMPQAEIDATPAWQKSLWHLYDCTDYAVNIANIPTVAYAGEIDGQKQASDIMIRYMEPEGLKLERMIGPKTGHKYEPDTRKLLDARLADIVAKGRNPVPTKIRFTTWTLRYNKMFWLTLDGLEQHWERARVEAEIKSLTDIAIKTTGVTALTVQLPAAINPFKNSAAIWITLDGQKFQSPSSDAVFAPFVKSAGQWKSALDLAVGSQPFPPPKSHGLQGPIDDAFMDSFIIVKPSAGPLHEKTGAWASAEADHAIDHWRKQFRGEAQVRTPETITDAEIATHHLILFGDPSSSPLIAKILAKLPIKWSKEALAIGDKTFPADHHMPAMIYPNPLSPHRYVVLNSGFTFREFAYLNNARQIPNLPDFAVIDISTPVSQKAPGAIPYAGFFDEAWKIK